MLVYCLSLRKLVTVKILRKIILIQHHIVSNIIYTNRLSSRNLIQTTVNLRMKKIFVFQYI